MIALRNGRPVAGVPVADRGLAYGDGLFETLKVVEGRPQFLELHEARLVRDCSRLDMQLDLQQLRAEVARIVAPERSGVLKLIISRSAAQRGYQAPKHSSSERLVVFYPQHFSQPPLAAGVQVRICRQRLAEQPALAGMKHLNRLEQVLARAEWSDPAIAEGLLLDSASRLVEGVASNVFLVQGGAVYTPSLHRCGVAGIVRELLLRAGPDCAQVFEADLTLDDLLRADELFLSNSVIGILPVIKVDCLHKPHGDVTIAIQKYFQTLCSRDALENPARIADR